MNWLLLGFWALLTLVGAFLLWVAILRPAMASRRGQKRSDLIDDIPGEPLTKDPHSL